MGGWVERPHFVEKTVWSLQNHWNRALEPTKGKHYKNLTAARWSPGLHTPALYKKQKLKT